MFDMITRFDKSDFTFKLFLSQCYAGQRVKYSGRPGDVEHSDSNRCQEGPPYLEINYVN